MNEDQWERFKEVWQSYGVSFTHDDGTYKSAYEVLKEMSQVWKNLSDDKKGEITHNACAFMNLEEECN